MSYRGGVDDFRFRKSGKYFKEIVNQSGYVLVLICFLIPGLLLGTKLVLDTMTEHVTKKHSIYKKCAREAALEVARKWNPALTYYQQRWALLKIADDIYNKSPSYSTAGIKYEAIPGLEVPTTIQIKKGSTYDPLKVEKTNYISLSPSSKTVKYQTVKSDWGLYMGGGVRPIFSLFHAFYTQSDRDPYCVLEDTVLGYCVKSNLETRFMARKSNAGRLSYFRGNPGLLTTVSDTIDQRKNLYDTTVQIFVEDDAIKVLTDNNVAYAQPAKCNIDIVLGIPVNGAACNIDNRDARSAIASSPYISDSDVPADEAEKTPIYQVAQSMRTMIKNNFYYTRGINIGIVPYCGTILLPVDRANWSSEPAPFNPTPFVNNQNTYHAFIRRCFLYGLTHIYDALNVHTSHYGIDAFSLTNVMMRKGKIEKYSDYGDNIMYCGDILSIANPADNENDTYSPKFLRRPLRDLTGLPGIINFLSMSMDIGVANWTPWVLTNQYHIVEITPDLLNITDLLNLFYPFNFNQNQNSNFIFIPVTWANNLFQSWTKDTKFEKSDTTADAPSEINANNSGRLSCPSKNTANRKKALILIVNKPDWFESNEITYLGYDNDFSEVPMIESDCIRFDVEQTNSKKFADETTKNAVTTPVANNRLYGAKKILSYYSSSNSSNFTWNASSSHYQCTSSATGVLEYPQKYLIKLVVEPASSSGTIKFTNLNNSSGNYCTLNNKNYAISYQREFYIEPSQLKDTMCKFDMTNIRLISAEITNRPYKVISETCSLSGTNIKTNVKKPLTVKVTPTSLGLVTFSNVENSNIDHDGSHILSSSQTFTFPSSNFDSNYGLQKVKYALSKADISNVYLDNQKVRHYSGSEDSNIFDFSNMLKSTGASALAGEFIFNPSKTHSLKSIIKSGHARIIIYRWVATQHRDAASFTVSCNETKFAFLEQAGTHDKEEASVKGGENRYVFNAYNGAEIKCLNSSNCDYCSTEYSIDFDFDGNGDSTIQFVTGPRYGDNFLNWFHIVNKDRVNLGNSNDANSVYLANDCINFKGAGDLSVTVTPTTICTLSHTNPSDSIISETFTSERTITIAPDNYKYTANSDGTYTIYLTANYVELSNVKIVDQGYFAKWDKIRMPKESRSVNYRSSSEGLVYNSNLMAYGDSASNSVRDEVYDSQVGGWVSKFESLRGEYVSGWHHHYLKNLPGDFYVTVDDIGNIGYNFYELDKNHTNSTYDNGFAAPGMYRHFNLFSNLSADGEGNYCGKYDLWTKTPNASKSQFIVSGLTLPINATLFHGADGTTLHKYAFQAAANSTIWSGNDATTGVQNVTVAALKKLYSDWSSNIRIYVILFRKQEQYSHPVTRVATNFNYDYITNLAANTSITGTAAATANNPIYRCIDVANEAGLNSTLSSIAKELKTWAGYTDAKVVE